MTIDQAHDELCTFGASCTDRNRCAAGRALRAIHRDGVNQGLEAGALIIDLLATGPAHQTLKAAARAIRAKVRSTECGHPSWARLGSVCSHCDLIIDDNRGDT